MPPVRTYRAGSSIEDYCRACKLDSIHTVVAVDGEGGRARGVRQLPQRAQLPRRGEEPVSGAPAAVASAPPRLQQPPRQRGEPFPIVSDRERTRLP